MYFKHYLSPSPILLPFHIISEISRTIALAVRLFGNMISLEMVAMILLLVAGFLMPVPILMLHIIEALVQAYIFGMLALIFIASAVLTHEETTHEETTQDGAIQESVALEDVTHEKAKKHTKIQKPTQKTRRN